jgi:hypothetical protein
MAGKTNLDLRYKGKILVCKIGGKAAISIMLVMYPLIWASSYWSMLRKSYLTKYTNSSEMSKVWL